jgi:hypothetical protein
MVLAGALSGALTTSTHAIAVGVLFAVGDAAVQFVVSETRFTVSTLRTKLCEGETDGAGDVVWDLGRTFTAFVGGATLGTALSLATLTVGQHLGPWEVLVTVGPAAALLLPFQLQVATGHARHFARNLPGYMLLLTLLNIVVGYPTLLWSLLEPNSASGLPQLVALQIRSMLVGFGAVGIFMFANRYPAKQWRMEMAPGEWAPRLHPVLIVAGQAAGNLSWVLLALFAVFSGTEEFPLFLTIPLMLYQVVVTTHMQLVSSSEVPVGTRMLRVFLPILTIPADHMQGVSGLAQSFNLLAFSAYTLWIGSFHDEWTRLYDEVEGGAGDDDSFILNRFVAQPAAASHGGAKPPPRVTLSDGGEVEDGSMSSPQPTSPPAPDPGPASP